MSFQMVCSCHVPLVSRPAMRILALVGSAALAALVGAAGLALLLPRQEAGMAAATATLNEARRDSPPLPPPVQRRRRRLGDGAPSPATGPVGRVLSMARSSAGAASAAPPLRILYVVTTLSEYDKGTRGTEAGSDRLANVVLPVLREATHSMAARGWHVDVYLILGYKELRPERRRLVEDVLPPGTGLEVWEDATPLHYPSKAMRGGKAGGPQKLAVASHGLSRQHRYVIKDKLMQYDFFACFEDDMRINAGHVSNFLEMSAGIEELRLGAEAGEDGRAHVTGESRRDPANRGRPSDGAPVGNDVVDDAVSADQLRRVLPGFVRVEVVDRREGRAGGERLSAAVLDKPTYISEVPVHAGWEGKDGWTIDPLACCEEDPPGRGRMPPLPLAEDVVLWETNVGAAGVRRYPEPIGWVAAMPVEDKADVGSYWSGEGEILGTNVSRPRRLDATLGQQAGWMATRSQIEYFHLEACPGGFLPPFDDAHWDGDSLKRHAVEFWSGGFQLFGQCKLNRVLSLDPDRYSKQLLYHTANNKQGTLKTQKFIRAEDFLGQLHTVKARAEASLQKEEER